jgi:VRR-NUC domain/Fanconi anemia-associated nuclease SAP domain
MQLGESSSVADPFYYLANFQAMIDTLQRRDGDLLAPEERRFIVDFYDLPREARALLVRMVMRKGPLFRASRLAYSEIADVGAAALPLIGLQWIDDRPDLGVADLFQLFGKVQVARYLGLPKHRLQETKSALLASLRDAHPERQPLHNWCAEPDTVYRLGVAAVCLRLRLMFFGNFRQDLSEFVLADLGVFRYESIGLHAESRPFPTRRHVDDFHGLYRCREMLHGGIEPAEIEDALPPPIKDCDWLEDRREKLRFQIARAYERAHKTDRAASIYSTCSYPEAQARAARLSGAASGRPRRLARDAVIVPAFELTLERPEEDRSVEHLVLDHLLAAANEETLVLYVENALINSLFGLLCWPAVFAPVPGAFFHPFHRGPADLSSAKFYDRRRREFSCCFAQLQSGAYRDAILRRFAQSQGIASPFVAWELIDERLLRTALACFPAEHLRLWFEYIVRDIRTNRAGFPDLVQFFPGSCRYRLIEVKAQGDRLQNNQRLCLEFMLRHQMPVSVCRVRWAGVAVQVT